MSQGTTYIIGAGLAGLSAATQLAGQGRRVIVYEAAGQAGGRCRSYYDETFGAVIDNGNHLLLSGNDAALTYLKRIGADKSFNLAAKPEFDFIDAKIMHRWTLKLNKGIFPFWLFDRDCRVPDTKFTDYFSILRLLWANQQQTVASLLDESTLLYQRLWHTFLLSALNTDPVRASARLAGAIIRGTLLKGGKACIPLVAEGLSSVFIDHALSYLTDHKAEVLFNHRLRTLNLQDGRASQLDFASGEQVALSASDTVICAVPAWNITSLLPDIDVPDITHAILNVHFRITPPASFPAIMGVINGSVEWIFAFKDRISITISNADSLMHVEREELAQKIWLEVAGITGLASTLPPWQIVKEKRATFAATPEQDARRPDAVTPWKNIYLAGDYVQNGLPATIEGAIRSGATAAQLVMART